MKSKHNDTRQKLKGDDAFKEDLELTRELNSQPRLPRRIVPGPQREMEERESELTRRVCQQLIEIDIELTGEAIATKNYLDRIQVYRGVVGQALKDLPKDTKN